MECPYCGKADEDAAVCSQCSFTMNSLGGRHPKEVLERMDRYSMQSTRVTPEEVEEKLSEVPFLTCGAYDDDCVYVYVEREGQLAFYWAHFSNWDGDLFPDIEVRDGDNIYAFHDHSCAGAFDCEGSLRSFIEVRA